MSKHRVLVTGAAGRIGSAFCLAERDHFELRLADLRVEHMPKGCGEVVAIDITDMASCLRACEGVETVMHLAANASPEADFYRDLLQTNILGTYNVFQAARMCECKRVVFASSAQTVEGYPLDAQIHEHMPTRPRNLYGVSKVFGEGIASYFATTSAMSTIAVRIANVAAFHAGEQHSARDIAAFISERDVVALLARCVEVSLSGFHVVHGVSNNRYKRLAIEQTRQLIGYEPVDDAFAILQSLAMKSGRPN